ncbi:MAG: N-acetylmuramoyl-L-alanine amidase [Desulfatibacillaceae bacterium]|nr:N-acetylmuramoyl-L-alanine amidase [Desulfatibacillaceae bacterium]
MNEQKQKRRLAALALAGLVACALFLGACSPAMAVGGRSLYLDAERCELRLKASKERMQARDQWLNCIAQYRRVHAVEPRGGWAPAALFRAGEMYLELYRFSGRTQDRAEGIDLLQRVVKGYPGSAYNAKAQAALAEMTEKKSLKAATRTGKTISVAPAAPATSPPPAPAPATAVKTALKVETRSEAPVTVVAAAPKQQEEPAPDPMQAIYQGHDEQQAARPAALVNGLSPVRGIRYWTSPQYTRVVVDLDAPVEFTSRLLKPDPALGTGPRLFLDLAQAILTDDIARTVPIGDDLLSQVRAGQYDPQTVRVVVDIKSMKGHHVFSLTNPFRIVIDVRGDKEATATAPQPAATRQQPELKLPPGALAKQLALGVSTIVIDAGHGGKDPGAIGVCGNNIHEKNIVLSLAKKVAAMLEKETGCRVIFTRDSDRYLSLEERTAIANTSGADLFLSIHANAHARRQAQGIETYFLNLATDEESIRVAARENATSQKSISDLQGILQDLMQNAKVDESSRLAKFVQKGMVDAARSRHQDVADKGVKQAPFYVLLGAQMPSVLLEVGFITNPTECGRLTSSAYQDLLAKGIANGVRQYMQDLKSLE